MATESFYIPLPFGILPINNIYNERINRAIYIEEINRLEEELINNMYNNRNDYRLNNIIDDDNEDFSDVVNDYNINNGNMDIRFEEIYSCDDENDDKKNIKTQECPHCKKCKYGCINCTLCRGEKYI